MQPGASGEGEVLLYSQLWDDFEVIAVNSQLPDLKWSVAPFNNLPADVTASASKLVKFSFQSPVAHGAFNDQIRFDIRPNDGSESIHHQYVAVHGKALRRLAIYGPAIDDQGVVELGNVPVGQGKRVKLIAKVRDSEVELSEPHVDVYPQFLKAQFAAHEGDQRGLYDITIELPDDVDPCQYNSRPVGRVRIDTHHPRIGVVELIVTFAVVPRQPL